MPMKTLATDPRELTPEDMAKLGVPRTNRTDAIRAMCLQCVGTPQEVRLCECGACPLFFFRMGSDPFRAPPSEKQMATAQRLAADRNRSLKR